MAKIVSISSGEQKIGYAFMCPACGMLHKFCTADAHDEGWPIWTLTWSNGLPTVRASILVRWTGSDQVDRICHSYITDGSIIFCGDSSHDLRGQTVELPDI